MHHQKRRSRSESQDGADHYVRKCSPDGCSCRRHDKRKRSRRRDRYADDKSRKDYRRSQDHACNESSGESSTSIDPPPLWRAKLKYRSKNRLVLEIEYNKHGVQEQGKKSHKKKNSAQNFNTRQPQMGAGIWDPGTPGPNMGYINYRGGFRGPVPVSVQRATNPLVAPQTVTTNGGQGQAQHANNTPVQFESNPPGYNNYWRGYRGPVPVSVQHATNHLVAPGTVTTNGGQGQAQPTNNTINNSIPVPSGSNPPGLSRTEVSRYAYAGKQQPKRVRFRL